MAFTLNKVVPWGRSFDEYTAMFALSETDLGKRILGCADGPSSFNCILTKRGGRVASVDPLYEFRASEIRKRIDETYHEVLDQTRNNQHDFVWNEIRSVEELGRIRMDAMRQFLNDYPPGVTEGRYIPGTLPRLPFGDREFDIAVCSHFLFLYSEQLSEAFHLESLRELCRVAAEARVFPLLGLGGGKSRHVDMAVSCLRSEGYYAVIEDVAYEFQRGGNQMVRIYAT
jgi:hypothetical protein